MKATNRNQTRGVLAGALLLFSGNLSASESRERDIDYAPTETPETQEAQASLPIDPDGINVVAGNLGVYEPDFQNVFGNFMNLWMTAKKDGASRIIWKLKVPEAGLYEVDALAAKGGEMSVNCNGESQDSAKVGQGWERVSLGEIRLKEGENTLQLVVEAKKGFEFDALELVRPEVKAETLKDALAMRQKPDWFKDAGYGLMFQWTNRATPPEGPIKPWEEKVNDFDLEGFVEMVESSGAAYVLWSIIWGNQYISAPIKSLDALVQGRTTERDLLGEMAEELHKRDIRLIFYYHYGYDCNHSIDKDWMEASGGYKADKTEFYRNWMNIVSEIGERYGDKLDGWWFDGGQRFYNCHFDNSPGDQGILSAPFKELTLASRQGNSKRVVAYNSWIKPRLTEYQDYYGGEGGRSFSGLKDGSFASGPKEGLQAHGCFILEKEWGHIKENTPIPKPRFDLKKLVQMVEKAQKYQYPLSINLEMYEDGSVSPESLQLLKDLNAAVRSN